MNPILVMCMGLGYMFNMYRNKPLVREGGVIIMTHPTYREFNPVHHPSYIDFYEEVLAETTDPVEMQDRFERRYAEDDWYRHLYRTGNAYHGVHPYYMWYWGAHALEHLGAVIIVGGNIDHLTRVMTTAIALETSKGDLALALALGIVLVTISLSVNAAVMMLRLTTTRYAYA